jgi:hypothetical protein
MSKLPRTKKKIPVSNKKAKESIRTDTQAARNIPAPPTKSESHAARNLLSEFNFSNSSHANPKKINISTFSKTLVTPEKQKEQWGAKKNVNQIRRPALPAITALPLIKWGGEVIFERMKYMVTNTCPIGN